MYVERFSNWLLTGCTAHTGEIVTGCMSHTGEIVTGCMSHTGEIVTGCMSHTGEIVGFPFHERNRGCKEARGAPDCDVE